MGYREVDCCREQREVQNALKSDLSLQKKNGIENTVIA
jgi:hypothetical protein